MVKEPSVGQLSLLTDFYELTMAASYFKHKKDAWASFDLFVRNLPKDRSFLLSAGLADIISHLRNFHFDEESIHYLKGLDVFADDFLDHLSRIRFNGDVWALPEGTIFFPNEPIVRIVAPLIEAQLIESALLNIINLQTTIATKASRVVLASRGKSLFDFSLRRTQGSDAAIKVARSAYIAGFKGTSNVLAGKLYGIPVVGTMAHSFIMSFQDELSGFRAFIKTFPKYGTLLVDTYDTMTGIQNAITIGKELEEEGRRLVAIRLDSGKIAALASRARYLLDKAGLSYVKIFASGNLDEYKINELLSAGAPIDSFGVGTKMGVSADAPFSDVIYKLNEITDINGEFLPTMKLSQGKLTFPGRKQVYRFLDSKGKYLKDLIELEGQVSSGTPLLKKVIEKGDLITKEPTLKEIKDTAAANLSKLPLYLTRLKPHQQYPVAIGPQLKNLTHRVSKIILEKSGR